MIEAEYAAEYLVSLRVAVGRVAGRVVVVRFSSGRGAAALVSSGRLTEAAGRVVVVRFSSGRDAAALCSRMLLLRLS